MERWGRPRGRRDKANGRGWTVSRAPGVQRKDQWRGPGGRAGAAGNPEVGRAAMGVRSVAISACGRGKIDTCVRWMAVRAFGAAVAVVALLSAAIALHWPPLHAGTGQDRPCGRVGGWTRVRRRGEWAALWGGLCLALARPALGSRCGGPD